MFTLSLPKVLYRTPSPVSHTELLVIQTGTRRILGTRDINYSLWSSDPEDNFTDRYWQQMVSKIKNQKLVSSEVERSKIQEALILGLGGGTLAYLLNKFYAPEKIDGVELDPKIIEIGKAYFYLNSLPNLQIIQSDAVKWIKNQSKQRENQYDVILMDIFQAETTPKECETPEFFKQSTKLLKNNGILCLNKIFPQGNNKEIEAYLKTRMKPCLKNIVYERYQKIPELNNVLIFGQKP